MLWGQTWRKGGSREGVILSKGCGQMNVNRYSQWTHCLGPPPWRQGPICHWVVGSLVVGWAGSWPKRLLEVTSLIHRQWQTTGLFMNQCRILGGKGLQVWSCDLGSHPNLALFRVGEDTLGLLLGDLKVGSQSEVLPGSKWAAWTREQVGFSTAVSCRVHQWKAGRKSGTRQPAIGETWENTTSGTPTYSCSLKGVTRCGCGRPLAPQHGLVESTH